MRSQNLLKVISTIIFLGIVQFCLYSNAFAQQQDVTLSVQISARKGSPGDMIFLKKRHKIDKEIKEILDNGRYKYVVGTFYNYNDAKEYRNELIDEHGLKDAFIVAIQNEKILNNWDRNNYIASSKKTTPQKVEDSEEKPPTKIEEENVVEPTSTTDKKEEPKKEKSTQEIEKPQKKNIGFAEAFINKENIFPHLSNKKVEIEDKSNKKEKKPEKKEVEKKDNQEKETTKHEQKEKSKLNTIFSKRKSKKENEDKVDKKDQPKKKKQAKAKNKQEENKEKIVEKEEKPEHWTGEAEEAETTKEVVEKLKKDKSLPFPQNILHPIMNVVETTFNSNKIIIMAIILIFYFQLSFILLVIFIVIQRFIKSAKEKKIEIVKEKYQNIIAEYLFSDEHENKIPTELIKINSYLKTDILVQEVLSLHKNLSGTTYERLMNLYLELSLHTHSLKKLNSRKWHIVATGIQELTQMKVGLATKRIEQFINHSNEIIRLEALLAIIRLNKTNPFSFLDKYTEDFTEWEKLNIHYLIDRHEIKIPDFKKWLSSHNDDVVIFCLQMIAIFKQQNAFDDLIKLLSHPNKKIIQKSITALGINGNSDASKYLKDIYNYVYHQNKIRIIITLGDFNDESNVDFLENILSDNNFDLRFHAAESLDKIGMPSDKYLDIAKKDEDTELETIVKHIFIERI